MQQIPAAPMKVRRTHSDDSSNSGSSTSSTRSTVSTEFLGLIGSMGSPWWTHRALMNWKGPGDNVHSEEVDEAEMEECNDSAAGGLQEFLRT